MSLEQEIVTILNLREAGITLPRRHREFVYFDTVYTDVDHTTKDEDTIFWMLARSNYESNGIVYTDYTEVLPYVENPERLRAYFVRGSGNTLMLFNFEQVSKIGTDVPLSVFLESNIFMKGLGNVTAQKTLWDKFKNENLTERLFFFESTSEIDFLGIDLDPSIVRIVEKTADQYSYMTYFSYYNRGTTILSNQYQTIDSLRGKGNFQSTMQSLWDGRVTAYILLPEAQESVFANVESSDGFNVNQFFIKKDMTVDLRQAGLTYLSNPSIPRRYTNNNLDTIAKIMDNVLLNYRNRNLIDSFTPTTWLPVEQQDPVDIANEFARGFISRYFLADELKGFELGLSNSQNNIDPTLGV